MPLQPHNIEKHARLPNEALLMRLTSEGDRLAYGRLYSFYYPQLYNSLAYISKSPEEAQEVIQDVFLKIWTTKESLIMVRSFEDYVFMLSKNLLIDRLRRKKKGLEIIQSILDQSTISQGPSPEQHLVFKQYYATALAALDQLSDQKKQIFLLRTQEGMKLAQIAEQMGISRPTVKKHLYSATDFIKEYLRKHGEGIIIFLFLCFL
ncbi:sigma-70 family RNA polymerase sigma factor [Flavitalea sp. BT771]|uniref:RNA polymerase sigma factor n=1 Tax=Flavitalea sp. BT771 TaxID=3063329 RepID=UPI0026E2646F|nr:sigma-70 family RNA polymerase sigma factor [Flavitalea sp. BT771]MDO6430044.1 sigma-70 family RNA polymerase sigma factor [Flavitalea sp. BT771]MDV6219817.1 sigma-70 family RNA polymerase sigma factor [Flavitalea sp. BT771]